MATLRNKANIGLAMMVLLAITLTTGIILHLKKHGILIEPRYVIKIIHWLCGFAMSLLAFVHWRQFERALTAMRNKVKWFHASTTLLKIMLILTVATGAVKLLSPVKIPHLGLWHYGMGIIMGIAAVAHLFRGIPSWNRMRKAGKQAVAPHQD